MGQTTPEIIREVEKGLEGRMSNVMSQSFENAGGVEAVAEMLNVADRATERALLDKLAEENPDLVDEIRRLMFVFEDICKFTDKDIQTVLKNVETNQWALALKGASDELTQKILGNMSERAAEHAQGRNRLPRLGQALGRREQAAGNRRHHPPPRRRRRRSKSTPAAKSKKWSRNRLVARHLFRVRPAFIACGLAKPQALPRA